MTATTPTRRRWRAAWTILLGLLLCTTLYAQSETECDPTEGLPVATGDVFFNYGSSTNAFSFQNRSDVSIGQPVVGRALSQNNTAEYGFWARFLLPPQAPTLNATQGDFPDRVLLRWTEDPLSATSSNGYVIKRDGAFLAELEPGTAQFIDFNVQPGEFYEYSIEGMNRFGTGVPGTSVGFINPNGTVTGRITTRNDNPVAGATVTLSPTMGRSLRFDGLDDYVCLSYDARLNTPEFALTAWVRVEPGQDRAVIIDRGRDLNKNYWITTSDLGAAAGAVVGIGGNGQQQEIAVTFAEDPEGWHHLAAVYAGGNMLVYVDGEFAASRAATLETEAALFHFGMGRDGSAPFRGGLDDVRVYDRYLTQTELLQTKDITASRTTPGLVAYWKCDEGIGGKIFDTAGGDIDGTLEGPTFDANTPELLNAGITDEGGYYIIEGVNYSATESFQARPSQDFYVHASVEFNLARGSLVTLPAVNLTDSATVQPTDSATIDLAFRPFSLTGTQYLLSRGDGTDFALYLEDAELFLRLNGNAQSLGPVNNDFHYLSLTLDQANDAVRVFRNGEPTTALTYADPIPPVNASSWHLGAQLSPADTTDYFTGLIGEVSFFNTVIPDAQQELHASPLAGEDLTTGVDAGDAQLIAYFPLDEGSGSTVEDYGPNQLADGQLFNASFSIIAYRQLTTPHVYRPSERIVNLNGSVTAVGNIDFVDESTVPITGVVRFSETFCYQDSVELLVNGEPYFPRIFTDENGRFSADFEPGANVILTPTFVDTTHLFSPPFYEVRNLQRPIAGVLFQNTTKREIEGIVAGGACQLSINDIDDPLTLTVASLNGCFERRVNVTASSGQYRITRLPPIPMRISVSRHFDPDVFDFFQVAGGSETDLRLRQKDTIDFIYTAPPQVVLSAFPQQPDCALPAFIQQTTRNNGFREYQTDIQVVENYLGGQCPVDSFQLEITNDIADAGPDTIQSDTIIYPYRYFAGIPRFTGDFTKFLDVTARTLGGSANQVLRVVVTGERSLENSYVTTAPSLPLFILRDPPGDQSFATLQEGTKVCKTFTGGTAGELGQSLTVDLDAGGKVTTYAGSPFGGTITTVETVANSIVTVSAEEKETISNGVEICTEASRTFTTDNSEDYVGDDGDLFVGAAVNLEISSTEQLVADLETCAFRVERGNRILPDEILTTYAYTRWFVETTEIPRLLALGRQGDAMAWRYVLREDSIAKAQALQRQNYSFDGGSTVSESLTSSRDSTYSYQFQLEVDEGLQSINGFEALDIGTTTNLNLTFGQTIMSGEQTTTREATTTQFTLADDDPNDNFTVDVLEDPKFKTPIFRLRAGESLCPWEPGTRNREQVGFNIDKLSEINVPQTQAAVFRLDLTNDGQTGNDALIYTLGIVEGSNPDGAVIQVNGSSLNSPRSFQILPDETIEVLLTVRKGAADVFNYADLGIFMSSQCMLEHSRSVGYDLSRTENEIDPDTGEEITTEGPYRREDLAKFYREFRLKVEFIEPCTPIDISFPRQGWVVTPADNERLSVTLTGYNNQDPDLDTVRLQYRPTGGDGSWINIQELGVADFANDPVAKVLQWEMEELRDGPYDIRATAVCKDLNLEPGISEVIQGRKETQPPELLGTPQPADGVLSPGDEISITFTKPVNCGLIFQADGIGTNINVNNLALIDRTTGELIDATISCRDDKIVVVPNIANQFIENRTLGVVVNDIQDFYGNPSDSIFWEFLVNRSALYWAGGPINELTPEGTGLTLTREIRNQGGAITSFTLEDIPEWMNVFPREGTLAPGAIQEVTFEIPGTLPANAYATDLVLRHVDGPEILPIRLRVACPEPDWSVDPRAFALSMGLVVELNIEGELSADGLDRIAAFVDGELRGVGTIEYVQTIDQNEINAWLAFLTVYGNAAINDTLEFQIWDASECILYGATVETFPFVPDGAIGEPLVPQTINTTGEVLKKIYLAPGWNWLSYNVDLEDRSTNAFLSSLSAPSRAMTIKDQSRFSQYNEGVGLWLGSLMEVSTGGLFQLFGAGPDSLMLVGPQTDPSTPIPLRAGWNWLGVLPSRSLTVNDALGSLPLRDGDIIKGQTSFATYVAGLGWVGNLDFLSSPNGYLLRLAEEGTLVYPSGDNAASSPARHPRPRPQNLLAKSAHQWSVNPHDFEQTMNLVAVVHDSLTQNVLAPGDALAVLVGEEVRGVDSVLYVPALQAHLVFLTVYANGEGEEISFRYYDAAKEREYALTDTFLFSANQVRGMADAPIILRLPFDATTTNTTSEDLRAGYFRAYPNPVNSGQSVTLDFSATPGEKIEIIVTDALGRSLERLELVSPAPENRLEWRPDRLATGIYTIALRRGFAMQTVRLVIH